MSFLSRDTASLFPHLTSALRSLWGTSQQECATRTNSTQQVSAWSLPRCLTGTKHQVASFDITWVPSKQNRRAGKTKQNNKTNKRENSSQMKSSQSKVLFKCNLFFMELAPSGEASVSVSPRLSLSPGGTWAEQKLGRAPSSWHFPTARCCSPSPHCIIYPQTRLRERELGNLPHGS